MHEPNLSNMEILERICNAGALKRAEEIECILLDLDIPFETQQFDLYGHSGWKKGYNFIVSFQEGNPAYVLVAHHDIDPGTGHGANDNTASVASLIRTAKNLVDAHFVGPLHIVLTDFEEPGNGACAAGAYEYAKKYLSRQPRLVLVLDVTGVGDVLCISRGSEPNQINQLKIGIGAVAIQGGDPVCGEVIPTPPSDDIGFQRAGYDAVLCCVLPREEVVEDTRRTWRTMHSERDTIDTIQPVTLDWVSQFCTDLVPALAEHDLPLPSLDAKRG